VATVSNIPETRVYYTDSPELALTLKPPTEEEFAPFWPLDKEVVQFLTQSDQRTIGSPAKICEGPNPLGLGSVVTGLYAHKKDDLQLIGVGYILAPSLDYPGIGQYIVNKEALGKGYGSLAIHALSRHILDVLGKPLVQATTLEANHPSHRSLEQAGFFLADAKNLVEVRPYGPAATAYSTLRQRLLYKPGDYTLPVGKFQNPAQDKIDLSKQNYLARNRVITIER